MAKVGAKYRWDEKKKQYVEVKGSYEAAKKSSNASRQKTGVVRYNVAVDPEWESFINSEIAKHVMAEQSKVPTQLTTYQSKINSDLYKPGANSNLAQTSYGLGKIGRDTAMRQKLFKDSAAALGMSDEKINEMLASYGQNADVANQLHTLTAARTGDASVLHGKKGQEKRELQGLYNLSEYDVTAPALMQQNNVQSFEELAELSKNFNLQDALLTVEDYYRGLYTPVRADGLSAAKVDRADYAKAASDIERFTGIDVRGLKPEEVEQKLKEIDDMSDTVDWMQNYMRWESERRDAEAALGNWEEDFTKNWGGIRDAADYADLSHVEKKKAPFWARNEYSDKDYMHPNEVYPAQAFPETYSGVFDYMTEEQLRDFTYLYNQPDDGEAQARAYLEDLAPELLRQRAEQQVKDAEEFASENGLTGTAAFLAARGANVVNSLAGATDMLAAPYRAVSGLVDPSILENDPNSVQYDYLRYAQALDQANVQNIAEATQGLNIAGINIPSQIYSGIASGADSLAAGLMYGPVASAALGANAYSSARFEGEDVLDAGMQALFEGLTEKYSLDSMFSDTGSIVKSIAKNMLVEPTEELANMALNIGWDRLRYGENGEIGTRFNELRAKGYDEHDASIQIASEYGREALATVISSAFAGAFGGAVGGTMAAVEDNTTGSNLQSNNAEKSMLELATTLPLPEDVMKVAKEQLGAVTEGAQTSAAKIGRVFREMIKTVDEQTQSVLEATMTRNVKSMLKANGVDDAEMAGAVTRIIADNGTATPEDYQRVGANDKALSLTQGLTATYKSTMQLSEKAARIAEQAAKKGQKQEQTEGADTVTDIENEPVSEIDEFAATDEELTAEAAAQMVRESAAEYGPNADMVVAAYEEGQDPVAYSQQFMQAYEYGEEGRNFEVISKSDSFSGLKPQQIEKAYTMGRGARVFRAEQAAKNRKGLVPVGNIDTTEIRGMNLNEAQRSSTRAISKLAQAVGFNVKYIASTANEEGKFTGKNGSWDKETRTITIDINAGRLSNTDTNYAIMQTAGHELTHFIKDFADTELFSQYQDFVFGHLSEVMDETALDSKVSEYIERWAKAGKTIDRDGAIEEIVADASGDALLKMTDADIRQLSEQNPSLLKKIGDFIKHWVADVKILIQKAYKGQTARNAIAEQMADAVDELGKRWNELLKNAAESARAASVEQVETVSEVKENQPFEAGKFLAYNHIDKRTTDTIRNTDTQLFCSEVEEAQIGFAAAANMLLSDLDNTVSGQKFFSEDSVTGQKRMTSKLLASIKDATGWTWDKIRSSLEQFAAMQTSDTLPKNTVTNREMELYLDEVLSNGYTPIDGQKVAPWDEYVEVKGQYKGSSGEKAPQSAYQDAIDFADYAFADAEEKFSVREVNGQRVVWVDDNIIANKPNDQNYADFMVDYLTEHVGEVYKIIESGQSVYLGKDLPKEYAWSKYSQRIRTRNQQLYKAKARMAAGVGEAISIASNRRWEKTKHPENKDAQYGVYKYNSKIAFPVFNEAGDNTGVQAYDITLVIRNASNGSKYLYDIQNIKKDAFTANTLYSKSRGAAAKATQRENAFSDNSIAEKGGEVKFSMRAPVEQTKDLIAVHNIREDNLRKALELGGFPMPSIAIAKRDIGHQNFGSISLVFGSDTIDPKANKRNKVYSADAWTPTFPQVEYEVNAKVDARVYNKLSSLKQAIDPYFADDLSRMMYGVEDQMNRNGGEEGLVRRALDNYGMKAAYLEEMGKHVEPVTRTEAQQSAFSEKQIEKYTQIAELVGAENIRKMPVKDIYNQYGDAINEIYPGASATTIRFRRIIQNVYGYLTSKDAGPKTSTVTDGAATHNAINEAIDSAAYERWVRDLYSGIEAASGVYNGKEIFTPSGNRRSFAATHYPATVQGIAKAMYDAHGGNVKNISANHDAKSLRAVTSKSFKSIDEMHKNEGRLKAQTQEEADELTAALDSRLSALTDNVLATKPKSRDTYESLMAHDQVVAILQEIAAKKYSAATIKAGYAQYGYNISDADAQAFKELLDDVSAMPVNIFEAKPERAVYFDEVKYAIVPDSLASDVRSRLEAVVPDVREYTDGDEAQRLELLNAREDLMFQLRDPDQISDRALLANVMESAAINEAELDFVRRYRKQIDQLNEKQAQLDETNQAIVAAQKAGKRADAAALRNKADILAKQIGRMDGQLLKFEAGKPLQAVVKREREALRRKASERTKARVETVRKQEAEKREKLNRKLAEVREKRDQKLAQMRQEKQDAVRKVRDEKDESFGKAKYRERLHDDLETLRTWVTSPTNKAHVPQFLRKPIGDMINSLDFSSARSLKGGPDTQKDEALKAALDAMNVALGQIKQQNEGIDKGASSFAGFIDLPAGYQQEFLELTESIKTKLTATQNAGDTAINRMTAAQLKDLSQAIRTLTTSIRQMNRLLANAKYESAVSAATSTIGELNEMAAKKDTFKAIAGISKFMDWTNTVPYYAFKRFGKGGQAIFEGLMDGWDKLAFNSDELVKFANDAYTTKEVRQWSREIRSVDLSNGETVRMTTSQLMSLYCLSKRAQAVGHLLGGGIRIADIDSKGKRIVQSDNYTLTERDLETFAGMLSERQRAVADKLQNFMSTKGAEWGNEVSMKRFGYEMFTERYYFPIETDANNHVAIDEQTQENSLFRLLNMSATKGLIKGANNALVVRDIFDVFAAHSSDMAKYNALGLQILDALKWVNYVERVQNDDGSISTWSVQKSLERAYGTDARKYILNLLRDLNGVREGGRNDGPVNKVISNAKIASVAGNVRVWLLQATSMPRAAYAINPKYLGIGFAKMHAHPKNGMQMVNDKVGIAKWKSMGFYDTNIAGNIREMVKHDQSVPAAIREKSMAPAGFMDNMTMGVIYYAAEAEIAEKHKGVQRGGNVWNKLVNDRVRDIVYQTQVVDSTMTRSDAMRGKGIITLATSFMSEPTLTMNMLADSIYDMRMKRRGAKGIEALTMRMVKAGSVFAFTAVLTAAVEALFDAERDDDEYETFGEKYMSSFIGELTEDDSAWEKFTKVVFSNVGSNLNILNNIPFASDAMSLLQGYDNSPMYSAFIDSFKSGWDAYQRWMAGEGTMYSWIYSGLKGLSQFSGLPVSNLTREGASIWNTFFADRAKKPRIQTYANTKKEAAEAYYAEIANGNTERAAFIHERARINGISGEDIADAVGAFIKDDFISGSITEAVARQYLAKYADKDSDKIDTNIRDWSYQRETGFKYSEMKNDYISGLISRTQMQTLLMQYRGYDSDEVYWQLSKWDYEKTTGEEGGKYDWFLDAVDSGSGYDKYAQDLLNHGVDKSDIAGAIAGAYKDAYLEIKGTPEGDQMLEYLLDVYESIGYDREYERKYISKNWK